MRERYIQNKISELTAPLLTAERMESRRKHASLVSSLNHEIERATFAFKQHLSEHVCEILRKEF